MPLFRRFVARANPFGSCTPRVWRRYRRQQPALMSALDDLRASQWWSAEQIHDYQLRQIREVVDFAYTHTRYYRELFDAIGLKDGRDIRTARDFERVPILTKDTVRQRLDDLTAQRDDLILNHTGGSTGVPLAFYNTPAFLNVLKPASMFRAYAMGGYRLGDPMGKVWGFDRDLPPLDRHGRSDGLLKIYPLNSFALTTQSMATFVERLRRDRVRFLTGYPTSLSTLAQFMNERGIELDVPMRAVFSEAERLDPSQRADIERAFGTRVFDYYGCREFSTNAVECSEHRGLHTNFEQLYTELSPEGALLLTSFKNRGTLFIRYEIGDYADTLITVKCSCRRASPRLGRVVGRQSDQFLTPDGRRIHGEYITHLFYGARAVQQFQIVQKSYSHFLVNVVSADESAVRTHVETVMRRLGDQLGYPTTFECCLVPSIPKTHTGKMKFTITELSA
jgi:phenylacetate-CoA ligase